MLRGRMRTWVHPSTPVLANGPPAQVAYSNTFHSFLRTRRFGEDLVYKSREIASAPLVLRCISEGWSTKQGLEPFNLKHLPSSLSTTVALPHDGAHCSGSTKLIFFDYHQGSVQANVTLMEILVGAQFVSCSPAWSGHQRYRGKRHHGKRPCTYSLWH